LNCGHQCKKLCHEGDCESTNEKCHQIINLTCECQHIKKEIECYILKNELVKSNENFNKEEFNIENIPNLTKNFIECNSECRILSRNKRLAEALEIDVVKKELPGKGIFNYNNLSFL
jgi:transcriptional repressor NF-X1